MRPRLVAAAAVAGVAVAGVAVTACERSSVRAPAASPSAAAPSAAAPATVPDGALLAVADAGPGQWAASDLDGGDWTLGFLFRLCEAATGDRDTQPVDVRDRALTTPNDGGHVYQRVAAYPPGGAAMLDGIRANVRACPRFRAQWSGGTFTLRIVADAFAGDESIMVEATGPGESGGPGAGRWLHVFVRVANLRTEVLAEPTTEVEARRLGLGAAARLCAATRTC